MSKVVGVALLVGIVMLLSIVVFTMATGLSEGLGGPATLSRVSVEHTHTSVQVRIEATTGGGSDTYYLVKVNGEVVRKWTDLSRGVTKDLYCLAPGDKVTVVAVSEETDRTYTVKEHTVEERTACKFKVVSGSKSFVVSPVNWWQSDRKAKTFYSYGGQDGTGHAHAHMSDRFMNEDTSYIFFYEYRDQVSLVVVHDKPNKHPGHCSLDVVEGCWYNSTDTKGGAVDMTFHGLPANGTWVVEDDPNDYTGSVGKCYSGASAANEMCYAWSQVNTDGGVFSGGFSADTTSIDLTITARWNENASGWGRYSSTNGEGITDWKFLSGNSENIKSFDLQMGKNVTIEGVNASTYTAGSGSGEVDSSQDPVTLSTVPLSTDAWIDAPLFTFAYTVQECGERPTCFGATVSIWALSLGWLVTFVVPAASLRRR